MEIKNLIYIVRAKQVMLDSDVARLYNYETKNINRTVKRNIERFPESFCFQLTKPEYDFIQNNGYSKFQIDSLNNDAMRFQNGTASNIKRRNERYLPYVFTEHGIIMLAGLLKNEIAIQVSLNIIDAFVEMRKFVLNNSQIFERLTKIEYKLLKHDDNFNSLFNELHIDKKFKQKIFYNGQIYDAYSLILDLIKSAKQYIILIDNYVDKTVLDLLSMKNNQVEVKIITKISSEITNLDIKKFNEQYYKLDIEYSDIYHDRFLIIDNKIIYHIGASLKDAGKKCFAITKFEDSKFIDKVRSMKLGTNNYDK